MLNLLGVNRKLVKVVNQVRDVLVRTNLINLRNKPLPFEASVDPPHPISRDQLFFFWIENRKAYPRIGTNHVVLVVDRHGSGVKKVVRLACVFLGSSQNEKPMQMKELQGLFRT